MAGMLVHVPGREKKRKSCPACKHEICQSGVRLHGAKSGGCAPLTLWLGLCCKSGPIVDDLFTWIKLLHILSATVLFGTGLGTTFQMWMAHRGGDPRTIATVARHAVIADYLFTTPAVIAQPVTGFLLLQLSGLDPASPWLEVAYGLYAVLALCWVPILWLRIKIRDYAQTAVARSTPLSADYDRATRLWFGLAWPAFIIILVILWLMVASPDLW